MGLKSREKESCCAASLQQLYELLRAKALETKRGQQNLSVTGKTVTNAKFNFRKRQVARAASFSQKRITSRDQAKKSVGRMPWHQEPKKDVISCEKPRGGANNH